MDFIKIFQLVKQQFENLISDNEIKSRLFDETKKPRLVLKSNHLKALPLTAGSLPEAITSKFIIKLLNSIGIENEYIVPQVRLKSISFIGKILNKYPDFGIFNKGEGKSLLFEIESLNKPLDKTGDEEGIEQAQKWFHEFIGLEQEYNAIITNFNEWYILKYDESTHQMKPNRKEPSEVLEIIRDFAIGKERSYLEEEKGEIITRDFYNLFSAKLNKLLDLNDTTINIRNLAVLSGEELSDMQTTYYRTIFFRMLFIKILLDWKLLPLDPIQEIFNEEKERNYFKCLKDLFFEVLNNEGERIDVLEKLTSLPYLNGGLFRLSEIEIKNPNISLNSEAIKEIWTLLKGYNFTISEENGEEEKNTINPSILGYIFEKSIGNVRKQTGTYYTRGIITNYISRNTLECYVVDKINNKFKSDIPWELRTIREIRMYDMGIKAKIYDYVIKFLKNIKICDPAVGSGAFLVSSANLLLEYYSFFIKSLKLDELKYQSSEEIEGDKRPFKDLVELKTYIVQNNLYGVDINSSAIEICELRLWLWIVQPPPNLDTIDIELSPLPNIEYNIREGNSLFGYTKGIKSIGRLDKKTKKEVKFAALSEWIGKEKESLSQMLIERNNKIKSYYQEKNETKRITLRTELKNLTDEYTANFHHLLLEEYQENKILGREIDIEPKDIEITDFSNIFSILIRLKKEEAINIPDNERRNLKLDSKNKEIRGISFRSNSVSLSYRVFKPEETDDFQEQNPKEMCTKIIHAIGIDKIQNINLKFLINSTQLENLKPFHWSMEFSDFFNSKGFDIVIANPPYGNILSNIGKLILKDDITEDIYLNFLLKLARKEIPFQYAGILTPKSYLLRQKYIGVRNELLSEIGPYEITDIGSKQFSGATNEVQILFFNKNHGYSEKLRIKDLFDSQLRIEYVLNGKKSDNQIDGLKICKNPECSYYNGNASFYYYSFKNKCPKCDVKTESLNRIRIKLTDDIYPIITKIEKNGNLNFLNTVDFPKMARGEEGKGLEQVKAILKVDNSQTCSFVYARDDFTYYFIDKNKSFDIGKIKPSVLKGDNYEYYKEPKLLIKHNSIVPETYYTAESVCFTSSIYSLLHRDKDLLKYLSALYNSSLMQFYCMYGINNQKDTTINLNQYMIRHLPVKKPNKTIIKTITGKVNLLNSLFISSNGIYTDETNNLIKEIDNTIFEIYKITEEERELLISLIISQIELFKEVYK